MNEEFSMVVTDFTYIPVGTLVKHSPHWHKECAYKPDAKKIGMVVDKSFYNDSISGVVCWPVIHWENAPMGHLCHPIHIVPHRKMIPIPTLKIAGDLKKPS